MCCVGDADKLSRSLAWDLWVGKMGGERGQVYKQATPDGGESRFVYDYAQRMRFSQNDRQKEPDATKGGENGGEHLHHEPRFCRAFE